MARPLTFRLILDKWLKKAKLRHGSHSVGLTLDGRFMYRGVEFGVMSSDGFVLLKWPAAVKPFSDDEWLASADPNFFNDLGKALKSGMTIINQVRAATKQ